jgi:FKBP-type peptidyl-prolyl cis-trans isomerase 2
MKEAKHGSSVRVHYRGKFSDGTLFDSSKGCDPLAFTIGQGQVIPGFENAVIGMKPGDTKTVVVSADQAYGPHLGEMMADVDRSQFPDNITPEIGQVFQLKGPDGKPIRVTIVAISGSTITLDANHPMAGKDLTFEIELMEIA